jgi:phosphatidylglycerol:prolipoprotein diacylglycerol transferase
MHPWLFPVDLPGIGRFEISAYFLWIVVGCVMGGHVVAREAEAEGEDARGALLLTIFAIAGGSVGARLAHVPTAFELYADDPLRVLQFWRGGLVFYGGLIGGLVAGAVWCRVRGLRFLRMADICAPGVALGLAFGRMGCFSVGCCYGKPIDWPFGIEWPWAAVFLEGQVPAALRGVALHPTQNYATFGALAIFTAVALIRRRRDFEGQAISALLILYGIWRSILELFRFDVGRGFVLPEYFGQNLSTSQAISIPMVLAGAVAYLVLRRRSKP